MKSVEIDSVSDYTLLRHSIGYGWRIDSCVRADIWEYIWKSNSIGISDSFKFLNMVDVIRIMKERDHEFEDIYRYPDIIFASINGCRIRFRTRTLANDKVECISLEFPCCWNSHHRAMSVQLGCTPDAETLIECAEFFADNQEKLFLQVRAFRKALEIRLVTLSALAEKFLGMHPQYQISLKGTQPILFNKQEEGQWYFEIDEDSISDVCIWLDGDRRQFSTIGHLLHSKYLDRIRYGIDYSYKSAPDK